MFSIRGRVSAWREAVAHVDDGIPALDAGRERELLDVDDQIAGFHVAGDGEGDVELANGLRPLVGQGGLLLTLLGTRGGLFGW